MARIETPHRTVGSGHGSRRLNTVPLRRDVVSWIGRIFPAHAARLGRADPEQFERFIVWVGPGMGLSKWDETKVVGGHGVGRWTDGYHAIACQDVERFFERMAVTGDFGLRFDGYFAYFQVNRPRMAANQDPLS